MFYTAFDGKRYTIGEATSEDLVTWARVATPVFAIDGVDVAAPAVANVFGSTACGTRGAKAPNGRSGSRRAPTAGWHRRRGLRRADRRSARRHPARRTVEHSRRGVPARGREHRARSPRSSTRASSSICPATAGRQLRSRGSSSMPGIRAPTRMEASRSTASIGRPSRVAHVHQRAGTRSIGVGTIATKPSLPGEPGDPSRSRRRPSRARRQRFRSGRRASPRRLARHSGRHGPKGRSTASTPATTARSRHRARDVGRRSRVHEGRPGPRRRRGLGRRDARAGEHRAAGQRHAAALVHRR